MPHTCHTRYCINFHSHLSRMFPTFPDLSNFHHHATFRDMKYSTILSLLHGNLSPGIIRAVDYTKNRRRHRLMTGEVGLLGLFGILVTHRESQSLSNIFKIRRNRITPPEFIDHLQIIKYDTESIISNCLSADRCTRPRQTKFSHQSPGRKNPLLRKNKVKQSLAS